MIDTILVPLDGSRLAEHALPAARRIAGETGATIVLVRVAHAADLFTAPLAAPTAAVQEADTYLWQTQQTLVRDGFTVRTEVLCRDPAEAIVLAATIHDADLIVMSTHGRSGFSRAVLGSVAEQVLHMAPVPVLLVRVFHLTGRTLTGSYRKILVPLDGTPLGVEALRYATQDDIAREAEITLLHAEQPGVPAPFAGALAGPLMQPSTTELTAGRRDTRRYLEALAQEYLDHNRQWHLYATIGDPAEAILHVAEDQEVDLIVMATHDRHGLDRLLQGSVTARVLHQADVPVLVLHGAAHATENERRDGAMGQVPQYIHWWIIQISVPNLIVIVLMLIVFSLALLLPYPRRRPKRGA